MTNSKKIYVKAYTRLNLGDDLFVFVLCTRYPEHQFYIKEHLPYTNVFKKINNINIVHDITNIKFDAIVYIGGSIFIENGASSISRVLDLKKEIIKENIPTHIIGANFGPYTSDEYFSTIKNNIFPFVKSITFRDKYSYNLFNDMNNVHYAPDVIFSIDTSKLKKDDNKEVGISIIHHLERKKLKINYEKYINKLYEISKHYMSLGYNIRLFSFCEYEKDMVAINELIAKFTKQELQHVIISNYKGDIEKIIREIYGLKLFITSRFHSIILGLRLNIPIIPICYSTKSTYVLEDLNFPRSKIYTFENVDNIEYSVFPKVLYTDLYTKAHEQFKYLDEQLKAL